MSKRVAVVTGGIGGLGSEICKYLARAGRQVIAADLASRSERVEAFRAYADHLASEDYVRGRQALMAAALAAPTCVMCAEAVWWRCHRRLVADDFVARGWTVLHLLAPGRPPEPHALHPDAAMVDGVLRYPGPQPPLL